tara:strand:+ start:9747 stop:10655 length:909 start_codon:yes stop_codon:yes gene_type:complete
MSRITNSDFQAGEVISDSDVASKFTDVATATQNIDENNVQSGAIDVTHMPNTSMFVKKSGVQLSTAPVTVQNRVGAASTVLLTLNLGGSTTVATNDLLRLYYQVEVSGSATTLTNYPLYDRAIERKGGIFWCLWLEYATDPGLTTWVTVKGQESPQNYNFGPHGSATSAHGFDFGKKDEEKQSSLMMIPHYPVLNYKEGNTNVDGTSATNRKWWDSGNTERRSYTSMRGYAHTGASYTMYGVRLQAAGVYHGAYIMPTASLYNGGLRVIDGSWPSDSANVPDNSFNITFNQSQLALMLLKEE